MIPEIKVWKALVFTWNYILPAIFLFWYLTFLSNSWVFRRCHALGRRCGRKAADLVGLDRPHKFGTSVVSLLGRWQGRCWDITSYFSNEKGFRNWRPHNNFWSIFCSEALEIPARSARSFSDHFLCFATRFNLFSKQKSSLLRIFWICSLFNHHKLTFIVVVNYF